MHRVFHSAWGSTRTQPRVVLPRLLPAKTKPFSTPDLALLPRPAGRTARRPRPDRQSRRSKSNGGQGGLTTVGRAGTACPSEGGDNRLERDASAATAWGEDGGPVPAPPHASTCRPRLASRKGAGANSRRPRARPSFELRVHETPAGGRTVRLPWAGGPRPPAARRRGTGIVGQLPRVRGRTPGLPRRGVRRRTEAPCVPVQSRREARQPGSRPLRRRDRGGAGDPLTASRGGRCPPRDPPTARGRPRCR